MGQESLNVHLEKWRSHERDDERICGIRISLELQQDAILLLLLQTVQPQNRKRCFKVRYFNGKMSQLVWTSLISSGNMQNEQKVKRSWSKEKDEPFNFLISESCQSIISVGEFQSQPTTRIWPGRPFDFCKAPSGKKLSYFVIFRVFSKSKLWHVVERSTYNLVMKIDQDQKFKEQ